MHIEKISNKAWFIWIIGGLFFLIDYFIRVSPSVITGQLMSSFHTNAFVLGGLSAIFYYAYIAMQIPVGIIFDRFNIKKPLIFAIVVCAVGAFLFALAHNIVMLYISRFLMGFSGAFAFIGALKIIQNFFPVKYFSVLAGITQALGMLGAAFGGSPMSFLMHSFGWRQVMFVVGIIFIALTLGIMLSISDKILVHPNTKSPDSNKILANLVDVIFKRKQTLINSLYVGFLYGPTAAFAGLWGVPYFTLYHHESTTMAAGQVSMIFIGLTFGCPLIGWFSNYMGKRLPVMRLSAILSLLLMVIVLFSNQLALLRHISPDMLFVILFLYGFFNSGIIPSYTLAAESNRFHSGGIALAFTNMASILIGALLLPIIGKLLDFTWAGGMTHHHRLYTIYNYQISLAVLPVCFIISLIASYFIKETYCNYLLEEDN
ncbi:MAG: MFS transporter [Pseudomonadota bacterium]